MARANDVRDAESVPLHDAKFQAVKAYLNP